MIDLEGLESRIRVLYLVARVYLLKEDKRPVKILSDSEVQGSNKVEEPAADPPPTGHPGTVVRAVIREQDGEMPKTSLDQDYPGGIWKKRLFIK